MRTPILAGLAVGVFATVGVTFWAVDGPDAVNRVYIAGSQFIGTATASQGPSTTSSSGKYRCN